MVLYNRTVFTIRSQTFYCLYYDLTQCRNLRENRQTFFVYKRKNREYNMEITSMTK